MASEFLVFVKEECATCELVQPVLKQLESELNLTVYSQDNPDFPAGLKVNDDTDLAISYRHRIETVPTLIRISSDDEERTEGWDREAWELMTGLSLEKSLPAFRPGCGSMTVEPGMPEKLAIRFGQSELQARHLELAEQEDEIEACFERGWSDGLPLVPPTPLRVVQMLQGTRRHPGEIIGEVPPDCSPCTIEKVAINAVMAGCKPEYLPVVIAAVEAALMEPFCMHGLLATTYFSGPMVMVNGPIARSIGMNSRGNALGQGNRANATIGRALQLVIRNVGGGKPGGVDRSAFGNPGKYTFCFAEDETNSCWTSYAEDRGFSRDKSTVTLFAADGVQGLVDQKSRQPESLARSFAAGLKSVAHPKMIMSADAFLVVSPEHERVFRDAGWSKADLLKTLGELLIRDGSELVVNAGGIQEGIPAHLENAKLPKFREGGLNIVRAGGDAGLFSAIIAGWAASGDKGSVPVTREIN